MADNNEISELLGTLKSDVSWIKEYIQCADKKYAAKWVEKIQWLMVVGVGGWMISQILNLIGTAKAMFL